MTNKMIVFLMRVGIPAAVLYALVTHGQLEPALMQLWHFAEQFVGR